MEKHAMCKQGDDLKLSLFSELPPQYFFFFPWSWKGVLCLVFLFVCLLFSFYQNGLFWNLRAKGCSSKAINGQYAIAKDLFFTSDVQDTEAFLLNCSHSWNLWLSITIIPDEVSFQSLSSKHNWNNKYLFVSEIEQTLIT